jgi:hypothetical protein
MNKLLSEGILEIGRQCKDRKEIIEIADNKYLKRDWNKNAYEMKDWILICIWKISSEILK